MSFIDVILSKLAPHDCLGCGKEGSLLCLACSSTFKKPPEDCYRCRQLTIDYVTCADCLRRTSLHAVYPAVIYDKLAKRLLWQLKASGAQQAAQVMARLMAPQLASNRRCLIVPVPTASSRARARGYDQARLLARQLGRQLQLPVMNCLVRSGQTHQKGANREQRLAQLSNSFRVRHRRLIRNAHLILVDDVITTGATLESAARVLHDTGAARIEAIAFARPNQTKPSI